jgi:hypothetical protein
LALCGYLSPLLKSLEPSNLRDRGMASNRSRQGGYVAGMLAIFAT